MPMKNYKVVKQILQKIPICVLFFIILDKTTP